MQQQRLRAVGPYLVLPPAPRFLLIMRLPLGDTLFVTPTIHALRQRYPAGYITALVSGTNAPLLAHNPDVNDVVVLPFRRDAQGAGALPATLRQLMRRRYDISLCFSTPGLGWLGYACRVPRQELLDFPSFWWLRPGGHDAWNRRHAVELYATAARRLRIPPLERRLRAVVTPTERAAMQGLLHQSHLTRAPLRVAIHPGSGAAPAQKRWPIAGFAEVARALVQQTQAQIIVVGGPSETALAAQLTAAIGPAAASLAGRLNLRQSLALLEICDLFIGNDSGPLHLATSVGTPVVGIYTVTDPAVFGPWAPADQAIALQPEGAEPALHFVGGAPIWRQIAHLRRASVEPPCLPPDAVIAAACRLLERRAFLPASAEAGG